MYLHSIISVHPKKLNLLIPDYLRSMGGGPSHWVIIHIQGQSILSIIAAASRFLLFYGLTPVPDTLLLIHHINVKGTQPCSISNCRKSMQGYESCTASARGIATPGTLLMCRNCLPSTTYILQIPMGCTPQVSWLNACP